MKKIYILDTNVLIHDPRSVFNFDDNDVVIPIFVLEELDKLKKQQSEKGKLARMSVRVLDALREKGSLYKGVETQKGGILRVDSRGDMKNLPIMLQQDLYDNRILALVMEIKTEFKDIRPVVFVTKDINLRVKSDSLGILSEDYTTDKIAYDELYTGYRKKQVDDDVIDFFYSHGSVHAKDIFSSEELERFCPNEFVTLISNHQDTKQALSRYNAKEGKLFRLKNGDAPIWGISANNREQRYAVELLLDPDIKMVTLVGKAGTGKTLIALAAGLEQVVEEDRYKRLFVARPIMPMGQDIGYLPGDEKQKLRPWVQPIYDNFEFLSENKFGAEESHDLFEEYERKKWIKVEALTYIRGRSIPKEFMIIDEAQNLTSHEIKTIVTRVGTDTKIIFTGDMQQIDHPYLDENSNGLSYIIEKFKNEAIAGHVTLQKGERSKLAELASQLL